MLVGRLGVSGSKLSGKFPVDLGLPPLRTKNLLESSPLESRLLGSSWTDLRVLAEFQSPKRGAQIRSPPAYLLRPQQIPLYDGFPLIRDFCLQELTQGFLQWMNPKGSSRYNPGMYPRSNGGPSQVQSSQDWALSSRSNESRQNGKGGGLKKGGYEIQ